VSLLFGEQPKTNRTIESRVSVRLKIFIIFPRLSVQQNTSM
jgi:hypothetical protein